MCCLSPDLRFEQKVRPLHTLGLSYDVMDAMKAEIESFVSDTYDGQKRLEGNLRLIHCKNEFA